MAWFKYSLPFQVFVTCVIMKVMSIMVWYCATMSLLFGKVWNQLMMQGMRNKSMNDVFSNEEIWTNQLGYSSQGKCIQ